MRPTEITDLVRSLGTGWRQRSTALSPLLTLTALPLLALSLLKTSLGVVVTYMLVAMVVVGFAACLRAYFHFMTKEPDRLHSERTFLKLATLRQQRTLGDDRQPAIDVASVEMAEPKVIEGKVGPS
jgi:Na+/melibiose symporter-like transporter